MRYLKFLALFGLLLFVFNGSARAQVRVAVGVGVGPVFEPVYGPPVCSHGYYDYYPYACAPYGYYGPDWFVNGVFIGAGPWFHGYYRGYYRHGYYSRPRAYYGGRYYGGPYNRRGGSYGGIGSGGYNRGFASHSGGYGSFSSNIRGGNSFHGGGASRRGVGGFHGARR